MKTKNSAKSKNIPSIKLRFVFILAVCLLVVLIFLPTQKAKAVTISQLILELYAQPGETIDLINQIYDDSKSGVTVYPTVFNFTEDPQREGSAILITDPEEVKPDVNWIKFEGNKFKLPVEGTLFDFPYKIEVPEDAEPGTHLIAIVYRTQPPKLEEEESSLVYIGTNVITTIFLRVAGTTIDQIDAEFSSGIYSNEDPNLSLTEKHQLFKPKTFFLRPPVDFKLRVINSGNTHQKPDGNVKIVNDLFGNEPEKLLVNPENRIVLPGTDRAYAVPSFGKGFMFGKYRAKLTLLFGDPIQPLEKEITFWIVPLIEIIIVILTILLILMIRHKLKQRRKRKEEEKEARLRQQILQEKQQQDAQQQSPPQQQPPPQPPQYPPAPPEPPAQPPQEPPQPPPPTPPSQPPQQ